MSAPLPPKDDWAVAGIFNPADENLVADNIIWLRGQATTVVGTAPRTTTIASSATPAFDVTQTELLNITAQLVNITSMTSGMTGTPANGQQLVVRIKGTAARTITWGANFRSSGTKTLLATTATTKTHHIWLIWDSASGQFVCADVDATGY